MRRADRLAGATLALAGIATALEAATFDVLFMTDPVGPKALPALVAVTFVGAGAVMILRPREEVPLPRGGALRRMALACVAFLTYATLMPWIGFFLSTSLVVAALATLFGGPRLGSVAAGLVLSSALWLLFVALLALPLPVGSLWIR